MLNVDYKDMKEFRMLNCSVCFLRQQTEIDWIKDRYVDGSVNYRVSMVWEITKQFYFNGLVVGHIRKDVINKGTLLDMKR